MELVLIIAGVLTGLLAGVFFGFSVAVNGGLHRLKAGEYVRAMQSINKVIINPLFMLSFMGPALLLPLAAFLYRDGDAFWLLTAASTLYVIGVFGVTAGGNVPLNDKLATVTSTDPAALDAARLAFEKPWNRLHTIRTLCAVAATALVFVACTV
jgi:uncharacterized membrane protein